LADYRLAQANGLSPGPLSKGSKQATDFLSHFLQFELIAVFSGMNQLLVLLKWVRVRHL
jgi:hypothetical protein